MTREQLRGLLNVQQANVEAATETAWLPLTITDGRKLEVRLVVSDGEAVLYSRDADNPRKEKMEVIVTASGGLSVIKKGNFQQRGTK